MPRNVDPFFQKRPFFKGHTAHTFRIAALIPIRVAGRGVSDQGLTLAVNPVATLGPG